MNRDELIEKARAAFFDKKDKGKPVGELIADFCLPLLAAERERAIEECALAIEACHWTGQPVDQTVVVKLCARTIRALRAPSKEHGGVAQSASMARQSAAAALARLRGEKETK